MKLHLTLIIHESPYITENSFARILSKFGTGQMDNTTEICPLLLKQECRKINAQRILVDNAADVCPLHSDKDDRKINNERV